MKDRGFVKWQPFNSVATPKVLLNTPKFIPKPTLFPEELEKINEQLKEAFYSHQNITIKYYDYGTIKEVKSIISRLNFSQNTIKLVNNQTLYFNQILSIN